MEWGNLGAQLVAALVGALVGGWVSARIANGQTRAALRDAHAERVYDAFCSFGALFERVGYGRPELSDIVALRLAAGRLRILLSGPVQRVMADNIALLVQERAEMLEKRGGGLAGSAEVVAKWRAEQELFRQRVVKHTEAIQAQYDELEKSIEALLAYSTAGAAKSKSGPS